MLERIRILVLVGHRSALDLHSHRSDLLLFVVKCKYPWAPKWKSITTKDKDGNIVTKYYRLDDKIL